VLLDVAADHADRFEVVHGAHTILKSIWPVRASVAVGSGIGR
jgi:hypothetical protein